MPQRLRDTQRTRIDSANLPIDTADAALDTLQPAIDTFSVRISADTLEGPVAYEAQDSAVLLIRDKKFILYGNTRTTYQDIVLTAPQITLDQATSILTAVSDRDSTGAIATRARFEQGNNKFQSDSIRFNFKTQQGLTQNTFTQQDEMFIQGRTIKKVDANTLFIREGIFTTCNLDDPHFAFKTNKLKVINSKVAVTGPTHPEFEGVPVPIYLPFGFFPLEQGRHSGLLPPQFTANEDFGLGLEGLGYYHVLNEYIDVTLRGNIYSYGGWTLNLTPTYRKRYRYQGQMNLSYQQNKLNFKGDPDYNLTKTFNISWSHSVDPRARPGTVFSANVNAGSTQYNRYVASNPLRNVQNQSSSVSYSKQWAGKPYNLSLAANHSQSNSSRLVNLQFPQANFSVTTLYPFQRKEPIGATRWYEKLGLGYNGNFTNNLSFYDTTSLSFTRLLDTMQWGARHSVPISLSLPSLGPLQVSPFISYEEQWLQKKIFRRWNPAQQKVDTLGIRSGFYTDRRASFGVGLNTALFGTYQFRNSRVMALRHVVRPNISANYTPDLSRRHFQELQIDSSGRKEWVSQLDVNSLSRGYSRGDFGGMTFGIDNNLEMKVRGKEAPDSGQVAEPKKIRIIDRFGVTSAYNFLSDSLKLQPFNFYLSSSLFDRINLTASALVSPYSTDSAGRDVNRFVWQEGRFRPGRFVTGSIALTTRFQSQPRDPEKPPVNVPLGNVNTNTDPLLYQDQQNMVDYMRRNPAEFVDFNIPWSIDLSYSLSVAQQRQPDYTYRTTTNSNVSFTTSFSLTPKWNFSTNGYYDFNTNQLSTFTMSVNRDMHCWQMSINVVPVGNWRSFNITISPKSSLLQDLRVNRTRVFSDF